MVVCLHASNNLRNELYLGHAADFVSRLFSFGDAGVPFFFVLSGFIVTRVHLPDFDHPARVKGYLLKRAARIYPVYWLVFALSYAAASMLPHTRVVLPHDALTLIKSLLLLPQVPTAPGDTGAPVVFVAWTLQHEMAFYAVMALALVRRWLLCLPVALYVLNRQWHAFGDGMLQHFFSNDLVILLAMGAGLAMLTRTRRPMRHARALCLCAALAFMALAVWDMQTFGGPRAHWRVLAYGLVSAATIWGLVRMEDGGWALSPDHLLVRLGNASYALYLIHIPVLSPLGKLVTAVFTQTGAHHTALATPLILAATLLMVAACCVVAWWFHRRVEQPITRSLTRRIAQWTTTGKPVVKAGMALATAQ